MNFRSDAHIRGAAVLFPAIDSGLFDQAGRAGPIALLVGLAGVAIIALLVAAAAHFKHHQGKVRSSVAHEELFTTTPMPMPKEEMDRIAKENSHGALRGSKLPRWVQLGSLMIALGFTWVVADRIRSKPRPDESPADTVLSSGVRVATADGARDNVIDSPEDLDLSPDSAPPFTFRARDWVAMGDGCAGRLEVTKGETSSWNLTARVHDEQGMLLDSARKRVASLQRGDVVEFTFANATCDRIGAWDVRGARRN